MEEENRDPSLESDQESGAVEKTEETIRTVGRLILGALAAAIAAELFGFRKKR